MKTKRKPKTKTPPTPSKSHIHYISVPHDEPDWELWTLVAIALLGIVLILIAVAALFGWQCFLLLLGAFLVGFSIISFAS